MTKMYRIFNVIALPKMSNKCDFQMKQIYTKRAVIHFQKTDAKTYRKGEPQTELIKDTRNY